MCIRDSNKGPYLSWVHDPQTTITISWQRTAPGTSYVEYGLDDNYGFVKVDTTFSIEHSIELTGLAPSSVYHYRVSSSDGYNSADASFKTAVQGCQPFEFVVFGDTRAQSVV